MKIKTFLICWVVSFIVVFTLNGLFHGVLAADFFDAGLSHLGTAVHKMSETNPLWVAVLDLILTFGMTYFILFSSDKITSLRWAIFAGGLINLISSGAWNFANASIFVTWSTILTIVDISWHILLGAGGGFLIGILSNKFR